MSNQGLSPSERGGLPSWTYFNPEMYELEVDVLLRRSWQLVCHVSDLAAPGEWLNFDVAGERALIIRGADKVVRAFHNVCRHRGSRVAVGERGQCKGALVCPFHGWTYHLDGTLRSVMQPRSLPELDPKQQNFGLVPIEMEIWHGFVFVRFKPGDRDDTVARMMAPFEELVAPYRMAECEALGPGRRLEIEANWKSVRDVDNEAYHVPLAHPTLFDLYGADCQDGRNYLGESLGAACVFKSEPARLWSVRKYKAILPEAEHLPPSQRRGWFYAGVFPNTVIRLYPDCVGFYQELPLALGRSLQRGAYYGLPDNRREMRLARYLSRRIDGITGLEDRNLIRWSWEAMQSSGFDGIILTDLETGVRDYHDRLRRLMPVMTLPEPPPSGELKARNEAMLHAA